MNSEEFKELTISTSPKSTDSGLMSPITPEYDALTTLPSPIVLDLDNNSTSIEFINRLPSPRIPKSYGTLQSRTAHNANRIVSEIDPSFRHLVTPPLRHFSNPLNKIGLEREHKAEDEPPMDLIYDGYDSHNELHQWKYVKAIGKGTFSTVVLGSLINENNPKLEQVAIKIVVLPSNDTVSRVESSLKRELNILTTMKHPSIINLLCVNISTEKYLIITPYYKGGDLFDLASTNRNNMSCQLIRKIFAEVAIGICYLHKNNIVHRDIKLENILINYKIEELFKIKDLKSTPLITITDFGLSREIDPKDPLLKTRCGSEDYVPPELLIGLPYDGRETDSWALGVLLYSIMESRLPFDPPPISTNTIRSKRQSKVAHRIARIDWSWYKYNNQFKDKSWNSKDWDEAKYLVENLLVRREKRLNSLQVCQSNYVSQILTDDYKEFMNNEL